MPDYERYLAHAAARHPGRAGADAGEISCAQVIERKYGRGRRALLLTRPAVAPQFRK